MDTPVAGSRKSNAMRICAALFVGVVAFFLFTEHRAHVLGLLPYLLVLACPLMHLFMHHGHRHATDPQPTAPHPGETQE